MMTIKCEKQSFWDVKKSPEEKRKWFNLREASDCGEFSRSMASFLLLWRKAPIPAEPHVWDILTAAECSGNLVVGLWNTEEKEDEAKRAGEFKKQDARGEALSAKTSLSGNPQLACLMQLGMKGINHESKEKRSLQGHAGQKPPDSVESSTKKGRKMAYRLFLVMALTLHSCSGFTSQLAW